MSMSAGWKAYYISIGLALVGLWLAVMYRLGTETKNKSAYCEQRIIGDDWGYRCDFPDAVCYVRDRNMACMWKAIPGQQ